MSFSQKKSKRFRKNASSPASMSIMSEINITPFVDVMLVLLIIFMVTAPLMTVGVSVDLPKTSAPALDESIEPLVISVNKEEQIFVQETPVDLKTLAPKLKAITKEKKDTRLFIRADQSLSYGHIMKVMTTLNNAGFLRVALLTENPTPEKTSG